MSLEEVTSQIRERVGDDCGVAKIIKFDFGDDGVLTIDGTQTPNVVNNDDTADADVTVSVSLADFKEIGSGTLNPQMAFMMGKLKIDGDMGVAMQLGQILG
ncbi:MAG: sterol-binding protein [Alphaproteobacteria bacterium]|nr:MAG: sterol-binding protein [Alphaproteobacteria bacterium]